MSMEVKSGLPTINQSIQEQEENQVSSDLSSDSESQNESQKARDYMQQSNKTLKLQETYFNKKKKVKIQSKE